jgi:hypothetical protein
VILVHHPRPDRRASRGHPIDGVNEAVFKSKKYLLPLAVLSPEVAGAVVIAYLIDGRLKIPKTAPVFEISDTGAHRETDAPLPVALPLQSSPRSRSQYRRHHSGSPLPPECERNKSGIHSKRRFR